MERDEPLHGPPERRVPRPPAHRLAERDRAAHVGQHFAEELARGLPLLHAPPHDVAARLLLVRPELRGAPLSTMTSSDTGTPSFVANASAALVGLPSLNAAVSGGPVTSSSRSSCASASPSTTTASLRGVAYAFTAPCVRRSGAEARRRRAQGGPRGRHRRTRKGAPRRRFRGGDRAVQSWGGETLGGDAEWGKRTSRVKRAHPTGSVVTCR